MKKKMTAAQKGDRRRRLLRLAMKAHKAGHRKLWKMLHWRYHKLQITGIEPTEEEALLAFK